MWWKSKQEALRVFIHLPKCGGTTIEANLVNHFGDRVFKFFGQNQMDDLRKHIDSGFKGVDFVTIHHPRFKYKHAFGNRPVKYYALARDPVDASVSLYNFATEKTHTRNYNNVRGMSFWQFVAYSHTIQEWRPNFQSYYLCSSRKLEKQIEFVDRIKPEIWRLEQIDLLYKVMTGREIDPSLVANVSKKQVHVNELTATEKRILSELNQVDQKLWSTVPLRST